MAGSRRAGKLPQPPTPRSPPAHGGRRCGRRGRAPPSLPPSLARSLARSLPPRLPGSGWAVRAGRPPGCAGSLPQPDTRALGRPEVNTRRWRPPAANPEASPPSPPLLADARGTLGNVVRARPVTLSRPGGALARPGGEGAEGSGAPQGASSWLGALGPRARALQRYLSCPPPGGVSLSGTGPQRFSSLCHGLPEGSSGPRR